MHLRGLVAPDAGGAAVARRSAALLRRRPLGDKNLVLIIVTVFVSLTAVALLGILLAKRRRRLRQLHEKETGDPGHDAADNMLHVCGSQMTESLQSSRRPSPPTRRGERRRASETNVSRTRILAAGIGLGSRHGSRNTVAGEAAEPDVDRSASIRSVVTLPPYSSMASKSEQVLGREGERDGIDVVIALPTDEDHEALREEEMDTLYQIRQTRRRQIAEREELRRQHTEARRRNDGDALAEIRAQSRTAVNTGELDELRREVSRIQETRQRSTSRVSYAELGVVRPDGTRVRANSNESCERMGLLSDAASIALSSQSCAPSLRLHRRGRSASSLASVDSELLPANPARPRGRCRSSVGPTPQEQPPDYHEASLVEDAELTPSTTPLDEPPPDYPGPVRLAAGRRGARSPAPGGPEAEAGEMGKRRTPRLPSLRTSLPAIVIEPSSARPVSR